MRPPRSVGQKPFRYVGGSTKVLSAHGRRRNILKGDSWVIRTTYFHHGPPSCHDERQPSFAKGGSVFLFLHREEGQGLAEYALIISIIAVLAILGLMFISGTLQSLLSNVGAHL